MKKSSVFLIFTLAAVSGVFAASLEDLVPGRAAELRQHNGLIVETQLRNPALRLMPASGDLRQVVNTAMNNTKPTILVETLYLYQKPQTARGSGNWNDAQKTGILNQLLAVSSLAGTQYYSASRGEMRTFFETSQVINNPTAKNPLPDPVFNTPPASVSIFARQKDLTFGDNIYSYNYTVLGDCIYFIQENVTSLNYGIIPVIGKNNLKTIMAVFDCGDSLLVYAASMAKASSVPGMGDRVSNSFGNRAGAMINWFTNRANIVYNM